VSGVTSARAGIGRGESVGIVFGIHGKFLVVFFGTVVLFGRSRESVV
jgi:hypothetical protein